MIYRKHPIRSLLTSMLRKANIRYPSDVCALSFEKYKRNFSKTKMYCYVHDYKYAPNLESLLTQQYAAYLELWKQLSNSQYRKIRFIIYTVNISCNHILNWNLSYILCCFLLSFHETFSVIMYIFSLNFVDILKLSALFCTLKMYKIQYTSWVRCWTYD